MSTSNDSNATKTTTSKKPAKRPFPWMHKVKCAADIEWEPTAVELSYTRNGETIRAGESFGIVRPDHDFSLGIATDHYKVTSHNATRHAIMSFCSDLVTPNGIVVSGHGYQVVHGYWVRHEKARAASVEGIEVASKLVVVNDHTGKGSLLSSLVTYVGNEAIGSLVRDRALHVSDQPERWHSNVQGMIETAMLVQDALLDLLSAAEKRILTEEDRKVLADHGIKSEENSSTTALDAIRVYNRGRVKARMSWGVYARRLQDTGILALCHLLGRVKFGRPIDEVLGGFRYGGYVKPETTAAAAE